jgi:hypothetical protein
MGVYSGLYTDQICGMVKRWYTGYGHHPYPSHNTNPWNDYSNPHENGLMPIPICGDHGTYGFKEVLMIDGQRNASEVTQAQVLMCQKSPRIKKPSFKPPSFKPLFKIYQRHTHHKPPSLVVLKEELDTPIAPIPWFIIVFPLFDSHGRS